jgi:biopolymer transport protein ExbB
MNRLFAILLMCLVLDGTAHAWWNDKWTLRKKITIDTSPAGGAISDPIGTTPVLIRLSDYNFGAGHDDGSDIRIIADDDKTSLPYHIERFDSLLGEAFVWVSVPNLKSGATTTLYLYYGNTGDTTVEGDGHGKPTYDSDTVLVYHFADKTGAAPADSSPAGNNGQNAGLSDDGSLIGPGLRLDGKTTVAIPASGTLAWAAGGSMTWSAWVKPAALAANAVIFSRRDGGNDLLVGADNGVPFIDVNGQRSSPGAPMAVNSWHHFAVVSDGTKTSFYVDGAPYATLSTGVPTLNSPSLIGADAPAANSGNGAFVGGIDEVEISRVARGPGFIKFAASEQSGDATNKTINVGQDEAPPAGWLSGAFGLFGVILKSVTIDGWVVIGILAIMSVVSWYVMITKLLYVNSVQKCNDLFIREWETMSLDLTSLDHGDAESIGDDAGPRVQRMIRRSPLYRIYHIGSNEIGKRTSKGKSLSTRSIQAIRASLDGGYVRENHALNSGLVFLTISIAGGPFMGLLGTVVGVMITFAAIAATGEVNISAIAPGLAAALVATVAGLLVAIPALLGYNYLTSRLKTVTSDLQIFIDEFVTKMAEVYSPEEASAAIPVAESTH